MAGSAEYREALGLGEIPPATRCGQLDLLELRAADSRLADYRQQGSCPNFSMVWNRNGNGSSLKLFLHNDMASTLALFHESMLFEDSTDFFSRQDPQLNQLPPLLE
jgi:hypothetical protein